MPHFEHPLYFLALLLLPGILLAYRWLMNRRKRTLELLGDAALVQKMVLPGKEPGLKAQLIVFASVLVLLITALADLSKPTSGDPISRKGVDVMIALDVSKSMQATDVKPNRIELARQFLYQLLDEMPENRVGLVVFAGHAYLQMPLTIDHGAARLYLQQISTEMVPTQGTVIGEALQLCQNAFNSKDSKHKAIVLLTDGEDHDPHALDLANSLKKNGIMVNTVGIGSPEGTQLMDPATNVIKVDKQGNPVISKLNEELLQNIAARTEGRYERLKEATPSVNAVLQQLDRIEKTTLVDNTYRPFSHYYFFFLILALLMFLWLWIDFDTLRKLLLPKKGLSTLPLFFIFCFPFFAISQQSNDAGTYEGNQLYLEKKLDKALIQYSQSLQQNPNNHLARFNLGVTYYRLQQFESAERIFSETADRCKDVALRQKAIYNKGVALTQLHKLPESIAAYKLAVKMNPNDKDARFNLEKALEELRQLKQKNNNQSQPQKQQEKTPKTKKEMEQWLESLKQKEQQIQKKIQDKKRPALSQPEKDW